MTTHRTTRTLAALTLLSTACGPTGGVGVDAKLVGQATGLEPGDLVITEVMADPSACSDSSGEWVEILNDTPVSVNLKGLLLVDAAGGKGAVAKDVIVSAGGRAVVRRGSSTSTCASVAASSTWGSRPALDNTGETLSLVNPQDGATIDTVTLGAASEGISTQLDAEVTSAWDNDEAQAWCPSTAIMPSGEAGSPGATNELCSGGCLDGQVIVDGECAWTCDGPRVPSEYPTVALAVASLPAEGGQVCIDEHAGIAEVALVTLDRPVEIVGAEDALIGGVEATVQSNGQLALHGLDVTEEVRFTATAGQELALVDVLVGDGVHTTNGGLVLDHSAVNGLVTVDYDAAGSPGSSVRLANSTLVALDIENTAATTNADATDVELGVLEITDSQMNELVLPDDVDFNDGVRIARSRIPKMTLDSHVDELRPALLVEDNVLGTIRLTPGGAGQYAVFANNTFLTERSVYPLTVIVDGDSNMELVVVNNAFVSSSGFQINTYSGGLLQGTIHHNAAQGHWAHPSGFSGSASDQIVESTLDIGLTGYPNTTSPVCGAGDAEFGTAVDITGAPRSTTAPTIGAYECR